MWLAYTTLTTIHTHLAVQYQMCVIAQLPHVLLLTTTLRLNAPTSLPKCVFGGGEVWQQTFAALYSKVSYAGKTDIGFSSFNGAAFPLTCIWIFTAMQLMLLKKEFKSDIKS